MRIYLYTCNTEPNRVDKTNFMYPKGYVEGALRDETSVTALIITIEYDKFIDFNYIYIPEFNRYYFVEDFVIVNNKLYELHTKVDVLMTYKNDILNLKGFVDRNQYEANPYIIDKYMVVEQGYDVENIEVSNNLFYTPYNNGELDKNATIDPFYGSIVINGYKLDIEIKKKQ